MRTFKSIFSIKKFIKEKKSKGNSIGLVPTMGFLHAGHLSLIKLAKQKSDIVVVSIFVNPAQFGPNEDFKKYPRDSKHDFKLLRNLGVDAVFNPLVKAMYPTGFETEIRLTELSRILCGVTRPTHFAGVATVVLKLFNIITPDLAIFGEKDYQQQFLIKRMVTDLNLDIKILTGKIVREANGLAMSSRNKYLSVNDRKLAGNLYKTLSFGRELINKGERKPEIVREYLLAKLRIFKRIRIEYLEILAANNLKPISELKGKVLIVVAARLAGVRLIDNVVVNVRRR